MSTLTIENYSMPSASMGTDNPLPDIKSRPSGDVHSHIAIDTETVTPDESKYMGWGNVHCILPYTIRDGYNRKKKMKDWKAVVLQNDFLKATFLPQLGGRLWSLIDLTTGEELLHRNPVFQPCNLALRNAWISGGVEWNLGIVGHTPFTVDSLHAEAVTLDDGTPVLRMYQYERVRGLVYRVEALLPDKSRHLLVRVRIDNTSDNDTAVYWWSNMAVNQRKDVRVLVPADRTFKFGYGGKLAKVPVPNYNNWDISYTTQIPQAIDFFFDLPDNQRRWIAAVNGKGYGFVQASTDLLRGRKLFVWGTGKGGKNWQTFLSQEGSEYLEIQAGLARTQLEHLPMGGGETLQWTEAYGAVNASPEKVHGDDWAAATKAVGDALEKTMPRVELDEWNKKLAEQLDGRKGKLLHSGDGWGYVESRICGEISGEKFMSPGLIFRKITAGTAEKQWLALLEDGALPCPDPLKAPAGYQVSGRWKKLLEKSVEAGGSDHWYGHYQLGVMYAYSGDTVKAKASFDNSMKCTPSPWALRCLAVLEQISGNNQKSADLLLKALDMLPQRNIAIEASTALLNSGRNQELLDMIQALPKSLRSLGRIKTYRVSAMLRLGDLSGARRILGGNIELSDVREGELSLSELWYELCARTMAKEQNIPLTKELLQKARETCPLPPHLDFRMS